MKPVIHFLKLPLRKKFLFIRIYFLLGYFRFLILNQPFSKISPKLGIKDKETDFERREDELRTAYPIKLLIKSASKYTPWKSQCLVQAMTAKRLLDHYHVESTVYLGVKKDDNGAMIAHAWVRCGKLYVTGGNGNIDYAVTGIFS